MGRGERTCLWLSAAAVGGGIGSPLLATGPSGQQALRLELLAEGSAVRTGWAGAWRPLGDLVDAALLHGGHGLWTAITFLVGGWVALLVAAHVSKRGGGRGACWLAGMSLSFLMPWGWAIGSATGLSDLLALGAALKAAQWAGSWRGLFGCAVAMSFGEVGLLAPVLVQLQGSGRSPSGRRTLALGWVLALAWLAARATVVSEPWGDGHLDLGAFDLSGGRALLGACALAALLAGLQNPRRPALLGGAVVLALALAGVARLYAGGSVAPIFCAAAVLAAGTLGCAAVDRTRLALGLLGVAACVPLAWRESRALAEDGDRQLAYAIRAAAATASLPGSLPILDSTWPASRLLALGVPTGQSALAQRQGAARPVWPLRTSGEERAYVRRPLEFGFDPEGGRRVVPLAAWGPATPSRLTLHEPATLELLGSFQRRRLDALLWTREGYAAARGPDWVAMGLAPGPGGVDTPRFAIDLDSLLELEVGALGAVLRRARRAGARHGYLELRWVDDARGTAHRPVAASDWIEVSWGDPVSTAAPASP